MMNSYQSTSEICKEETEMKGIQLTSYTTELSDASDAEGDESGEFSSKDLLSFSWQIAKGMVNFCRYSRAPLLRVRYSGNFFLALLKTL